jgi:cytochrome b6-f complex iron-sulfur subunit
MERSQGPPDGSFDSGRRRIVNWFLGTAVGGLIAAVVYPVIRFVSPPDVAEAATDQVEAGRIDDPEFRDKGFKIIRFGVAPVIVIRVADDDVRAFSATCTHLACIVEYQKDQSRIWCNCHNGEYDLHGKNVGGPPPKPLTPYTVHLVRRGDTPATVVVSRA